MKRNKLILAAVLAFGAISGAVASSARPTVVYFYHQNADGTGPILSENFTTVCPNTGGGCIQPTAVGNRQLYSDAAASIALRF